MSTHSLFSPSKAHMWMSCPGSTAFPENQEQGGSSTFADDGTVSHLWSADCLLQNTDAGAVEAHTVLNGKLYTMDETRASFIQQYLDDVRRRAIGGTLFVEYKVDLSKYLGPDQGGTADALIFLPATKTMICEDLKYGTGEKVYAKDNPQLLLYLLGALQDAELLGYEVEQVTGVICQPRLGHIDETTISVAELREFGKKAALAVKHANKAMPLTGRDLEPFLNPGEKQCRWCRAKAICPQLATFVSNQVRCDFETMDAEPAPVPPRDTVKLATAYSAVPLIEDWCRAVSAEVNRLVTDGVSVIGPDGKPYKFVEGREGARGWSDPVQAESALLGQLGPEKAYQPMKVITAPQAAKLLDKKATKALWTDMFEPLIRKPPGKAILVAGSDPRPPYSGAASADEFEEIGAE